jgi:Septum formation
MERSAEDGGGPPTAVAPDPAAPHPVAVPQQRSSSTGTSSTGTSSTGTSSTGTSSTGTSGASSTDTPPGQQPAAPRRATDGVAVAALVSGIIPVIPVTLVLGPLALIRVGRSGARGRALAITGLVLAGLWIVAGAIVAAAIITRPPPPKPVALPPVFSLRAGQCIDSGASGISGVHVLSCGQAHDAEVFATFRVAGSRYPGAAALQQRAGQGCVTRLSGYLNPQLPADSLAQSYIYPGAGAWSAGERTVVCTVRSTSGPLVGSVRAAAP